MPEPNAEDAFVQLVVTHQAALRAFVLSLMPGSPDVDDVIQEANAEIWKKRGEFRIGTNFKSWMFSVAKFKVMSAWRDQSRKKEWTMPEETLLKLAERMEAGELADTEEKHATLRVCIGRLKPVDRLLVLRRYLEDVSLGRMASETGRTADSLKVSLHRIRMVLRACLKRNFQKGEAAP